MGDPRKLNELILITDAIFDQIRHQICRVFLQVGVGRSLAVKALYSALNDGVFILDSAGGGLNAMAFPPFEADDKRVNTRRRGMGTSCRMGARTQP